LPQDGVQWQAFFYLGDELLGFIKGGNFFMNNCQLLEEDSVAVSELSVCLLTWLDSFHWEQFLWQQLLQ
jgi:hypothetical protein